MKQKMMQAVTVSPRKPINMAYALLATVLTWGFLEFGLGFGTPLLWWAVSYLPPAFSQWLFFHVDPLLISLLGFAFPTLLLFGWVAFVERRSLSGLGFYKKGALWELGKGWLIGFAMITAVVGLQVATGSLRLQFIQPSLENIVQLFLIMPFWLIQSGTEEVLTRGWLFPVVSRRVHLVVGVLVSSLLFSFLHIHNPSVNWISLVEIGLFGLLACLYVLKTDNIWGISGIHAAWNCFQGNFYGLPVSGLSVSYSLMRFEPQGAEILSGGSFGPEASIFSLLVTTVVIVWLAVGLYRSRK